MDLGLHKKTVLVTAASQGFGRAIAQQFVREGAKTYICARTAEKIQSTAQDIGAEPVVCDVSDTEAITTMVHRIGQIDILVTNAGGPPPGSFLNITDTDWQNAFTLTFLSAIRLIRAVLPGMQHRHWGRIICLTSTSVKQPIDNLITSNALRSAVANMAKTLATEVAKDGVTVNVVAPGMYDTDRLQQLIAARADQSGYMFAEEKDLLQRTIPAQRFGKVDELARVVTFLGSEASSYVTGTMITVDGGFTRSL